MFDTDTNDLVELSDLRQENKALKALITEWTGMAKDGVLCCGCDSGKGPHCKDCGIKLMEKQSKKLLRRSF